jgi:poly(3-hydroxybutyrate) depolymerase
MGVWLRCVLVSLLLFTTAAAPDPAGKDTRLPDAPINERVINVEGDPSRPVSLEVTLFTPPGPGPFPLAVLNHGADKVSATNRGPRYRYTFSADYFLSRGYAVALPMARGFAESGGTLFVHRCDLDQVGLANARDLRAVMAAISHEPSIDANRIVVAGRPAAASACQPVAGTFRPLLASRAPSGYKEPSRVESDRIGWSLSTSTLRHT